MAMAVRDDLGRHVVFPHVPRRVVSLVPSETETLFSLGVGASIVARTRYCVEPAAAVDDIEVCGGTKDPDVEHIVSLAPDLVLANQEENSRATLEALAARGVRTFVSFPRRVANALAHVARLARIFAVEEPARDLVKRGYSLLAQAPPELTLRVFVPIWPDPLMTFSDHTYASDLLRLAGAANVFGDRERKYPLKAELGLRSPLPADQVAHRDLRYPRIREQEIVERAPELILLPDEPYAFTEADRVRFAGLDTPAGQSSRIAFVDGKDLFWCGSRSVDAVSRLRAKLETL